MLMLHRTLITRVLEIVKEAWVVPGCGAPHFSLGALERLGSRLYTRLQRWSFFCNDGMVMFFFQGTIAINGFSMVLPALDHHHWMFFYRSTIDINGFPMVFPNSGAMVSDGFDLERDLKMRVIVSASIFNSSDQQVPSWIFKDTLDRLLLLNLRWK